MISRMYYRIAQGSSLEPQTHSDLLLASHLAFLPLSQVHLSSAATLPSWQKSRFGGRKAGGLKGLKGSLIIVSIVMVIKPLTIVVKKTIVLVIIMIMIIIPKQEDRTHQDLSPYTLLLRAMNLQTFCVAFRLILTHQIVSHLEDTETCQNPC